jgi:hypothetical protein
MSSSSWFLWWSFARPWPWYMGLLYLYFLLADCWIMIKYIGKEGPIDLLCNHGWKYPTLKIVRLRTSGFSIQPSSVGFYDQSLLIILICKLPDHFYSRCAFRCWRDVCWIDSNGFEEYISGFILCLLTYDRAAGGWGDEFAKWRAWLVIILDSKAITNNC